MSNSHRLHHGHSLECIEGWSQRLRYFRFVRAIGGHANDGDSLNVSFRHHGPSDLEQILASLGVGTPNSGHLEIAGVRVFVWHTPQLLQLFISGADGDPYEVSESDVAAAEKVEAVLGHLADRVVGPDSKK